MGKVLKVIIALIILAVIAFIVRSIFFSQAEIYSMVDSALNKADNAVEQALDKADEKVKKALNK